MVLCSVSLLGVTPGNFFATWVCMSLLGLLSVAVLSGSGFYLCYAAPTFDTWQRKTNPRYPSPEKVRDEIVQMVKGLWAATLCPAFTLWLSQRGYSQAYCSLDGVHAPHNYAATADTTSLRYLTFSFLVIWVGSDFFEFFYHRLGHVAHAAWAVHKHHHTFYNPSPFSVIADEYADQFVRATPLILFPLLMPVDLDLLFAIYALFFYVYGVYLHMGHELEWPDAHHPVINTSFQHYIHHAKAVYGLPYHCGFFLKVWDDISHALTGKGVYPTTNTPACACAKCCRARGERSEEKWDALVASGGLPDYSRLFTAQLWADARWLRSSDGYERKAR